MADFSARAPVEPNKIGDYLHDRARIPEAPTRSIGQLINGNIGLIIGVLLAMGAATLVFELRDAWESHRDWVPPAALVPAVLGAVALGHLAQRGKINYIGVPVFLLFFATFGPILNIWMHHEYPGKDGLMLTFTIASAVCLAVAALWLVIGSLVAEVVDPTRPPEPEM